ncbi:Polycystin-2 (Polycystic kidney disease 2 protein homolog) [Durusdinium trenchii]|uniref:Polycystin-2 (Polycystic kidney disease 2 protein homolog) n=1 Tax=Durusdinium trenchii TaxID=1381693 RepID=A0ABP0R086_9DINO
MSKILESAQKGTRQRSLDDDIRLMAGSMLTYSNLIYTQEGTETQAVKMVVRKQREKLLGCLMLPLAFMYFILFSASIMLHEDISDVYMIESELRANMDSIFDGVEDIDSLWDTLMGDFSQIFFTQTDMYGRAIQRPPATATDKWGTWGQVGVYNQIQGAIRFQQTRRTAAGFGKIYMCNSNVTCFLCRSNRGFQPAYLVSSGESAPIDCGDWPDPNRRLEEHTADPEELSPRRLSLMQPTLQSSLPKESSDEMQLFRFYIYPSEDLSRTMERLQYFRGRNWLDEDSRVLQIRLYLLNSELGQPNMEQVTLTFFFADGGSIYYSRDFQAIFFKIFPNTLCMVADGFFFLTLCFTGILQAVVLWRALWDRRVKKYLSDIRNLLELLVIAIGIYFCAQFYMVFLTKEKTTEIVTDLRANGWYVHDEQQKVVEDLFQVGESASNELLSLRLLAANYTLILTFRFFANFQAQPQLAIITNTLGSLIVEIIHFIVVFIPAILVYVFSATLLFGRRIQDVSTFWGSMGYIFRMTQEGEYDWEAFQEENYWSSAIWVWSFVVFVNMLLINLLIAIILDTYKEVQKAEESREAVSWRSCLVEDAVKEKSVQALWYVVRPGYMVALFLVGWAANVSLFTRYHIDYAAVLGITKEEFISSRFLVILSAFLALMLSLVRMLASLHGASTELISVVLLCYVVVLLLILGVLPRRWREHCRWREPFAQALRRCVWPDTTKEIPFAEVLVADGLTSVAKLFFDLTTGSCIVISSSEPALKSTLGGTLGTLGTLSPIKRPELTAQGVLATALDQCSGSSLPYLAWSVPFLIRARQCVITARHAPDAWNRDLQRINLAKYLSALPVVFFAMCHARVIPGINGSMLTSEDFEVLWALAAIVNSAFSFLWDLVMDWGLLHWVPLKLGNFGLRPTLLYPQPPVVYYFAIVLNFIGRTLWSLRWSEQECAARRVAVHLQGQMGDEGDGEGEDGSTIQPMHAFVEQFPNMPQYQLDLILADSEIMMEAQANKDINTEKLVKMAGSLMNSVSGVNENLEHIMKEESRDPLQSWVVGKNVPGFATNTENPENMHKGSRPPRIVDPFKVDEVLDEDGQPIEPEEAEEGNKEVEPEEEKFKTLWLIETENMMKAQRSWLVNASWHLDQLNAVLRQRAKQIGAASALAQLKGGRTTQGGIRNSSSMW